ncbi:MULTISPECIES: hypothetical protein [unclassified Streptomyces]|uniref:hypothetical protein n=1 Tax=unclassified Streptomyces TaxID=2593676 RepID=UPI000DC7ADCC|nr:MULTISPECIES: hypothetical protein [unclassified Streptomyces]AWZ03874.1 hypothetical protein DRB89_03640 [Streptomyces sp. ICC4]AWZ11922.1 hypothetical protein DRB96_05880 [Streptomyces sp. ICC1]
MRNAAREACGGTPEAVVAGAEFKEALARQLRHLEILLQPTRTAELPAFPATPRGTRGARGRSPGRPGRSALSTVEAARRRRRRTRGPIGVDARKTHDGRANGSNRSPRRTPTRHGS